MSTQIEEDIRQNELLTVKEVAIYLRVSRVTVWRWCQRGVIPASQVGRNWRIRREDLLHLLTPAQPSSESIPDDSDSTSQTTTDPAPPNSILEHDETSACVEEKPESDELQFIH